MFIYLLRVKIILNKQKTLINNGFIERKNLHKYLNSLIWMFLNHLFNDRIS